MHGDKTVAGLWQLLSAEAQWSELRQEKRTLENRLRKHCLEALDWAMPPTEGRRLARRCLSLLCDADLPYHNAGTAAGMRPPALRKSRLRGALSCLQ